MTTVTEPNPARGENERTARWPQFTYWPLTFAAAVFLFTYTLHVIGDVQVTGPNRHDDGDRADLGDVLGRLLVKPAASHPRGLWFRTHKFDLVRRRDPGAATLAPAGRPHPGTPLSPDRRRLLRARLLDLRCGAGAPSRLVLCALVLDAERGAPGAPSRRSATAVWWAFCTVTTVGLRRLSTGDAPRTRLSRSC